MPFRSANFRSREGANFIEDTRDDETANTWTVFNYGALFATPSGEQVCVSLALSFRDREVLVSKDSAQLCITFALYLTHGRSSVPCRQRSW